MSTNVERCIGKDKSMLLLKYGDFWDFKGLLETTCWRRRSQPHLPLEGL